MVRHWGAGSLAEHVVPAELNANIRLEPGKHELTAEEIAAASQGQYRRHRQWLCPLSGGCSGRPSASAKRPAVRRS